MRSHRQFGIFDHQWALADVFRSLVDISLITALYAQLTLNIHLPIRGPYRRIQRSLPAMFICVGHTPPRRRRHKYARHH